VQNISKKVIMSNENRFNYVGQKVLSILFKHSI
jgi:hypothetical protein